VEMSDPAERGLFRPVAAVRARLSSFADAIQFLTIRRTLSVVFAARAEGRIAGLAPAIKAARMDPIEALHYE